MAKSVISFFCPAMGNMLIYLRKSQLERVLTKATTTKEYYMEDRNNDSAADQADLHPECVTQRR